MENSLTFNDIKILLKQKKSILLITITSVA